MMQPLRALNFQCLVGCLSSVDRKPYRRETAFSSLRYVNTRFHSLNTFVERFFVPNTSGRKTERYTEEKKKRKKKGETKIKRERAKRITINRKRI